MPFLAPVIAAVGAAIEAISLATVIANVVIGTALSLGLSYLARAFQKKPDQQAPAPTGVQTSVTFGGNQPRNAIFGQQATAGQLVYWNVSGASNERLQLVYQIGDGLHDSLAGLFVGGIPCTIEGSPATTDFGTGYPVTEFRDSANNPTMLVQFFNGADSQAADADLVSFANPAGRWTSDNTGTGVAYVRVSLRYAPSIYTTGIPQFLFVIKGLRLYDPRKDSTNGGSGSHRWGDQTTYEWSANSTLCLYNYQRGIYVNGSLILGQGVSSLDLVNDAYIAAANSCDDDIDLVLGAAGISSIGSGGTGHQPGDVLTLGGGTFTVPIKIRVDETTASTGAIIKATVVQTGHFTVMPSNPVLQAASSGVGTGATFNIVATSTEKRYRVGCQVTANIQHRDAVTSFLTSMAGTLLEDAGSFAPLAGVAQTVAMSFTDADLIVGQKHTYSSKRSRADLINAVFGTYSEPTQNWASISSPPRTSSADETEDGERLASSIDFPMIWSGTQAQRVEEITRRLARLQSTGAVVLPFKFSVLEAGDWVTWTSARFGFTKTFLITATSLNPDQTIALTLRETSSAVFDWTADSDELAGIAPTNLAGFNDLFGTVSAFAITAIAVDAAGGLTAPAIRCAWTSIVDPTVTAVLVEYRIQGTTDYATERFDDVVSGSGIIIKGIQADTVYEARATIETKPSRVTAYTSWVSWASGTTPTQIVPTSTGVTPGGITETALDSILTSRLDLIEPTVAAAQEALDAIVSPLLESINERAAGEAAIMALLNGQANQSSFANQIVQTRNDLTVTINGETSARVDAVNAILVIINDPTTGLSTRASSSDVITLQTAVNDPATGNTALGGRTSTLEAAVNSGTTGLATRAAAADVTTLNTIVGTSGYSGSSLAARATALESSVNDGTTGLSTRAAASDVTALETLTGDATHGNTALAGRATALEATVNNGTSGVAANYSSVVTLQSLTGDATHGNLALASSITTLTASYNSISASGQFKVTASAGSGGATSQIDFEAATTSGGTYVAGLQLASFVDIDGTHFTRARLSADSTEVGVPGVVGGEYLTPFLPQIVNGSPSMALVPDAIPDDSIMSRVIAHGALNNIVYKNGTSVTKLVSDWYNSGNGDVVISVDIDATAGNLLLIDYDGNVYPDTSNSAQGTGFYYVKVNGSTIWSLADNPPFYDIVAGSNAHLPKAFRRTFPVTATGKQTVEIWLYRSGGAALTSHHQTIVTPMLIVQEVKKGDYSEFSSAITKSVSYVGSTVGGASSSFTGASIGTADSNRVVVVALGWRSVTDAAPTLTIGGATANLIVYARGAAGGYRMALYELRVTTGTTADIVATIAGGADDILINVWRVIATSHTPAGYGWNFYSGGGRTNDISAISGQELIVCAYGDGNISGFTQAWSGSETPSEEYDANSGGTPSARYAGYHTSITATGGRTITVNNTGTGDFVFVTARW